MASLERSRKEENNYMKPVQTQSRLEKRAVIISSKPSVVTIFFFHVLLGLGSGFVLGFTADDKIRFTNANP